MAKMKKETKEMLGAAIFTGVVVILAINANTYIVNPAVAWVRGKMAKPVAKTGE
jgi:hypothetical protein